MLTELWPVVLLGLTVAFTALPLVTVVALLLDTRRPVVGWVFTGSYAAGIFLVYVFFSIGAVGIGIPAIAPDGATEIAAGVILLGTATVLALMPPRPHRERARTRGAGRGRGRCR